jgi:ribosomal protein S18 acetylase RimI-like enzyme
MTPLGRLTYLRPCTASDDAFLYALFSTTWESEVAALPNQNLAQHVLRIQHIAQERRFASRYPGHDRFVVLVDDRPAGRLYVHQSGLSMHVVDLTLMPEFRSRGLGSSVVRDLFEVAAQERQSVTLRVGRRNRQATDLCSRLGFSLVMVDDLDNHFEWTPADVAQVEGMKEGEQQAVHLPSHSGS